MSETVKKKPDFNKLNFGNINTVEPPVAPVEVPLPIEGLPTKRVVQEGAWIYGKNIKDVTPDEFKQWLTGIIPEAIVDKWEEKTIATPKDRERVIVRLSLSLHKVFCFPRTLPVSDKEYVN